MYSNLFALSVSKSDTASLRQKAMHYFDLGDENQRTPPVAMDYYKKSLEIARDIGEYEIQEFCYGRFGKLYTNDSLFTKALNSFDIALEYCGKHKNCRDYIWFRYKGTIYRMWDKYNLALHYFKLSEELAVLHKDELELSRTYSESARLYLKIDLSDLMNSTIEKLIPLALKYDKDNMNQIYGKLADVHRKKGQYKKALELFYKALNSIPEHSNIVYRGQHASYYYDKIGDVYSVLGDPQIAEDNYKHAFIEANSVHSLYFSLIALLDICEIKIKSGNTANIENYLHKLDSLNIDNAELDLRMRLQSIYGELALIKGDIDSSLFYYKKSVRLFEKRINSISIESARSGYIDSEASQYTKISNIYKNLIADDTTNFSNYDSLFQYSNIIRSRTLNEKTTYKQTAKDSFYISSVKSLKKYQRAIRLSGVNPQNVTAVGLNSLRYQLLSSKLYQYSYQVKNVNQIFLPEFQEYLTQTHTAAVIYNLSRDDQYAFYLDGQNSKIIDLDIDPDTLQSKIKYFMRSAFSSKSSALHQFNTRLAYEFYCELWKPLQDELILKKNIIIIPDKPISTLPFDILLDHPDEQKVYKPEESPEYIRHMLINKYNFAILPSANLIKSMKPLINHNRNLIVANPDFTRELNTKSDIPNQNGWTFKQLIYSKVEAKSIQKILNKATLLEQSDATLKNVQKNAAQSSIIHFATHAFIDSVFNMFSGLVLSLDKDTLDDGFLMGYEINNLNLDCDLVTLSACESGQGKVFYNEGIMGLPRLFFAAGTHSVLMTMWEVDDKLSSDIMPYFYNNLVTKKMSKIEALGEAKRYIIKKYSKPVNGVYYNNPFYWASYNLYGDVMNNLQDKSLYNTISLILLLSLLSLTTLYIRRKRSK